MRSKQFQNILIILGMALSSGYIQIVHAAPAPDKLVVNHETRECATIFGGDECMDCLPPDGWEVLGWSYQAECPEGYAFTQVEETCTPFKNEFCCTERHSGAHGDCEDMVLNRVTLKCAFVDDIHACNLPFGWQAKPERTPNYEWACPDLYRWTEDLACEDEPISEQRDGSSKWLPFRCGGFALGGMLFLSVVSIRVRRKK